MKQNAMIDKYAMAVIRRLCENNELYTREQFERVTQDNKILDAMYMTIAVNRALGIGKRRFVEKVNPVLHEIEREFLQAKKDMGEDEAYRRIKAAYDEIMEG